MTIKNQKLLDYVIELGKKTNFERAEKVLSWRISHKPRIHEELHYKLWQALNKEGD